MTSSLGAELLGVRAQQHVPALAVLEVEVREQREGARSLDRARRRARVEAVEVDGARQRAQARGVDAAALEALEVELARHPDALAAVERRRPSRGGSDSHSNIVRTRARPRRVARVDDPVVDVERALGQRLARLAAPQQALGLERDAAPAPRAARRARLEPGRIERAQELDGLGAEAGAGAPRSARRARPSRSARAGAPWRSPAGRARKALDRAAAASSGQRRQRGIGGEDVAPAAGRRDVARDELDVGRHLSHRSPRGSPRSPRRRSRCRAA